MSTEVPPPGVYPQELPPVRLPHAEVAVWERLKRSLPEGWYAWHSMKVRDDEGRKGEGDFIILDPGRGLLVVEVKGGTITCQDHRWFSNGKPLEKPPIAQAEQYEYKLRSAVRAAAVPVPSCVAVVLFPDTSSDALPLQGDLRQRIMDRRALQWFGEALSSKLDQIPEQYRRRVPERTIAALHGIWGDSWKRALNLGRQARLDHDDRLELDARQLEILDGLQDNPRLRVRGVAGSGKTLLAVEGARRFAASGKRTLLTCFTMALEAGLRQHVGSRAEAKLEVSGIAAYAADLLREAGQQAPQPGQSRGWEDVLSRAGALIDSPRFDAVVIDEAQDLGDEHWQFVERLVGDGPIWAFGDKAQAFWADRAIPEKLLTARFQLTRSYRCPASLLKLSEAFESCPDEAGCVERIDEARRAGSFEVVVRERQEEVAEAVEHTVRTLMDEDLRPTDIAVLSLRGQAASDSALSRVRAGLDAVEADHPSAARKLVADTFLRFKGLERPAVVITDMGLVTDQRAVRFHIAMTRACMTVRLVTTREALASDPLLRHALPS